MIRIILLLFLATVLSLFSHFSPEIKTLLKTKNIPRVALTIIIFIIVSLVTFLLPLIEEVEKNKQQKLVESKLDKIIGKLEYQSPQQPTESIPPRGIKINIGKLKDEGTIAMWYTAVKVENIKVQGKFYLADLFSGLPNKDRISLYFETIENSNYLVIRTFDANKNTYLMKNNIDNWKNNTKYHIALTFSAKTEEINLYLNGAIAQKVRIENLKFESLGPELYLHRSYSGKQN